MRKHLWLVVLSSFPLALAASPAAWCLTPVELEADCTYVFNPGTATPAGLDAIAQEMMIFLSLPGIIGVPVESWDTADLEWQGGYSYGDGIPDCYQWGILGAALCAGDPLITAQFNANKAEIDTLAAQLSAIAATFVPIKEVIGATATDIYDWAWELSDPELMGEAMDLAYFLSDTAYDLDNDVGVYIPILTNLLPRYTGWLAALGGMSTGGQETTYYAFSALMNNFLSGCSGRPVSIWRLTTERDGLLYLAGLAQPPMTSELAADCTALANLLDAAIAQIQLLEEPELEIYGVNGKAADEPFSAEGDYNGDGVSNAEVYAIVSERGGDRFDFVLAAAGGNPFWDGNPSLPAVGPLGLVIVAGAILGWTIRKRG